MDPHPKCGFRVDLLYTHTHAPRGLEKISYLEKQAFPGAAGQCLENGSREHRKQTAAGMGVPTRRQG